jgi:hypothetical protein
VKQMHAKRIDLPTDSVDRRSDAAVARAPSAPDLSKNMPDTPDSDLRAIVDAQQPRRQDLTELRAEMVLWAINASDEPPDSARDEILAEIESRMHAPPALRERLVQWAVDMATPPADMAPQPTGETHPMPEPGCTATPPADMAPQPPDETSMPPEPGVFMRAPETDAHVLQISSPSRLKRIWLRILSLFAGVLRKPAGRT